MTHPNWFFAFPLPGVFVQSLPPPPAGFRLFHPEDVHLTLTFLGGCGAAAAERGLSALDAALRDEPLAPIEVSLADVVPMGRKGEYSALSATLDRGRAAMTDCIARLRDPISEAAIGRLERRPPLPHVTIARPRRNASAAAREQGLAWALGLDLHEVSAVVDRIALYTWSQGNRQERLFEIAAERPLPAREA
jgi:RNA 2',3'-cyclic 3'-phosphodiesterase